MNTAFEICPTHKIAMTVERDCSICRGTGEVQDPDDYAEQPGYVTCWNCRGSGVSSWLDCEMCLDESDNEG